jgi:UbiD family decarboxylase
MTDSPVRNLRQFLRLIRRQGELATISVPVSADQEIPEIHRRVVAAGGPALLFENVEGSPYAVVTNLFGTLPRTELAFGKRPQKFVADAARFAMEGLPPTPKKLWEFKHLFLQGLKVGFKRGKAGPVTEVVETRPRLTKLPLLKLWPEDGGHFITLPLVYTEGPHNGKPNLGMYRIQRYNDRETGIHWQIGKGGGFHHHEAERANKPLPTTIFIGGPPALILSAIAPLPEEVPEMLLASLLLGERLPLAKNPAGPHPLVAECEFALVGEVPPHLRKPEGPFGDHYGYYSLKHDYPVFQCRAVCRRRRPIYPATVVGKPRQEDYYIGDYLQELLSPLFPLVMPSVKSLWSYGETGFHSLAAAVVKDRYPREALQSAFRILGEGQLSLTKFLLLTDTPMDLREFRKVLTHLLARVNWETDLYVFSNLSMDTLDYTGPEVNKGSKGVIVGLGPAVRDLPGEFHGEPPPGVRDVRVFCPGCVVLSAPAYADDPQFPDAIAQHPAFKAWPLVILADDAAYATASEATFLWTVFTRFEPAADIHSAATRVIRKHVAYTGPVVIDARLKPWYPKVVQCDPDVAAKVTRRWKEYFPQGMEMGSSEHGHLLPAR